jgi:hypothetical protein
LDQLEAKQNDLREATRARLVDALRSGLASNPAGAKLYEQAIEATRFEGMKGEASAFQNWKKANADLLRSPEMQGAIRLHLQYLLLGLQRGSAKESPAFAVDSWNYARELAAFITPKGRPTLLPKEAAALLTQSCADGPFSKWLALTPWLPKGKTWEPAAGNLAGILEKNVRPVWRQDKAPSLLDTWDLQISLEASLLTEQRLEHGINEFNAITRPRLLFARAMDASLLATPNDKATRDALEIIRSYPQHPDFELWVAQLRKLLATSPSPTPSE